MLGTVNLSGLLKPILLNGFVPTVGESFTFLNYGAVSGTLSIFNPNVDNLSEHWEFSYFSTHAVNRGTARPRLRFNVAAAGLGLTRSGSVSATVAARTMLRVVSVITGNHR